METYGAKVKQVKADVGAAVTEVDLEKALKEKQYKVVTFTHVDTSTGEYTVLHVLTRFNNPRCRRTLRCQDDWRGSKTRLA